MTVQLDYRWHLPGAFATNLAFLWKHRGAVAAPDIDMRQPLASAAALSGPSGGRSDSRRPVAVGVARGGPCVAPISLVQAVISGGLVFLAVLADRWFGFELGRREWMGVGLTALGLAFLGLTVRAAPPARTRATRSPGWSLSRAAMILLGTLLMLSHRVERIRHRHGVLLGASAGILFGVSDIAIKALTGTVPGDVLSIVSPWTRRRDRCLDRSFLHFRPGAAGRRGPLDDRDHDRGPRTSRRSSAASSCSATRWASDAFAIAARACAFALVIAAAALTPAPVRAASRAV